MRNIGTFQFFLSLAFFTTNITTVFEVLFPFHKLTVFEVLKPGKVIILNIHKQHPTPWPSGLSQQEQPLRSQVRILPEFFFVSQSQVSKPGHLSTNIMEKPQNLSKYTTRKKHKQRFVPTSLRNICRKLMSFSKQCTSQAKCSLFSIAVSCAFEKSTKYWNCTVQCTQGHSALVTVHYGAPQILNISMINRFDQFITKPQSLINRH